MSIDCNSILGDVGVIGCTFLSNNIFKVNVTDNLENWIEFYLHLGSWLLKNSPNSSIKINFL